LVAFDYNGWLAVFIFAAAMVPTSWLLYLHERRGRARARRLYRYRSTIGSALFITFLAGLRRFVLHV
jgi:hypothetical protein